MALHRKHCSQSFFSVKVIGSDNWYRLTRHSRRHLPLAITNNRPGIFTSPSKSVVYCQQLQILCSSSHQESGIISPPLALWLYLTNRMKQEGLRVSSEPKPKDILKFLLLLSWKTVNMWICLGLHDEKPYRVTQLSLLRLQICNSAHLKC